MRTVALRIKYNGEHYRFSLERQITRIVRGVDGKWEGDRASLGDPISSKTEAERDDRLRNAIRDGTLHLAHQYATERDRLTLAQLMHAYRTQYLMVHRAGTGW